jgi:phage shock protein A
VSDPAEPDEIVDAEIVPDDAPAPSEQPPVPPADTGYTPAGVPTFDAVREKIETRYGTAIGSAELASETAEGRGVEEQYEARQRAAHERLEQIRASMRDEPGSEPGET